MDKKRLSYVIYAKAKAIYDAEFEKTGDISAETADTSELLKVLSRIMEGKSIERAFGAPGYWGYKTPIGGAIARSAPVASDDDLSEVGGAIDASGNVVSDADPGL